MDKPQTTADCIEVLDLWIETLNRPTHKPPEMQRQIDVMTAIRAKLLAADEMAEALEEAWPRTTMRAQKALTAYRAGGGK